MTLIVDALGTLLWEKNFITKFHAQLFTCYSNHISTMAPKLTPMY